jgi:hypothetical protein
MGWDWQAEGRDTNDEERDQNAVIEVGLNVEIGTREKNTSKRTSEFSLAMRSKMVLYVLSS